MNRRESMLRMAGWTGAALLASATGGWACRIRGEEETEGPQDGPSAGRLGVLVVTVRHTHRRCTLPIEKTRFAGANLEILGATPWEQETGGTYVRKMKVRYGEPGVASLRVIRSCSRGDCSRTLEYTVREADAGATAES